MLAYLFWHSPKSSARAEPYEAALKRFHELLAAEPSNGFVASASFRVGSLPWMPAGAQIYEDWYVLENSSALDALNGAAVSGARAGAHERLAVDAGAGAGAVYKLRSGSWSLGVGFAHWFAKPEGTTYAGLDALLNSATSSDALWQRYMVLGPSPEFCLISPEGRSLNDALAAQAIARSPVA